MSVGSTTTFSELERYGRLYSGGKVASTPDGTLLACTCGEELSLVDVATGKLVLSVSTEGDELTAFALHPHRPEIVTAGRSRLVRHWAYDVDGRTCQQLRSWKAHKLPAVDLAYDQTGTLAASAGADGAVMVFDVPKGFCTHVFRGHSGVVVRVLFQPNEMRIASCGEYRGAAWASGEGWGRGRKKGGLWPRARFGAPPPSRTSSRARLNTTPFPRRCLPSLL
jgi:U3 small nucleolar RNA-associated protein 13